MKRVWLVHVTSAGSGLGAAEVVQPVETAFSSEQAACAEALARSVEPGVAAVSVTSVGVDELGGRTRIALFVSGERQRLPHFSDRPRRYVAG